METWRQFTFLFLIKFKKFLHCRNERGYCVVAMNIEFNNWTFLMKITLSLKFGDNGDTARFVQKSSTFSDTKNSNSVYESAFGMMKFPIHVVRWLSVSQAHWRSV